MVEEPGAFPGPSLVGLAVTFRPGGAVRANLEAMLRECGRLIVVDNGSGPAWCDGLRDVAGLELIANRDNAGLATALNQGMRRAMADGFGWVLVFDQDSLPRAGLAAALWATLQAHATRERVAVVGANICEAVAGGQGHRWLRPHPWFPGAFAKTPLRNHDLPSVTMAITSGSLLRVADFLAVGPFAEELFIDYVDTDYCLRCREAGRLIAVSRDARLEHAFGARDRRRRWGLSFTPTNHAPRRHYFVARNRMAMIRRHGLRHPHWLVYDLSVAGLLVARVLAVEDGKRPKLRAMLLGTWDGLRGRLGPCPENRCRQLEP